MILPSQNNPEAWTAKIVSSCKSYRPERFLTHGKTCLDIGCNVGGFIINYHEMFDQIYAYDAASNNIKLCNKNLKDRGITNAVLTHAAVGHTTGETLVLRPYDNKAGNMDCGNFGTTGFVYDKDGHGWQPSEYDEQVESISLESILDSIVGDVDLMKVDIEGAEFDFLYGKDLSRINVILMEIHNFLVITKQGQALVDWISKTHDLKTPYKGRLDNHEEIAFVRKENA